VQKYSRLGQVTYDNMSFAWWIPKTTDKRSEYETLTAFTHQQWSNERARLLLCTYIFCLAYT
jgi:hypothetical protein